MMSKEFISWSVPEHPHYERGFFWYAGSIVLAGLLLIYAVRTSSILFAFIIIIFAIIFLIHTRMPARSLLFSITEDGLRLGTKTYPWRFFKSFWIIYEPPEVKNLYFEFGSGFNPRLTISLEDQEPVRVREAILQYLIEDTEKTEEPISEWFGRVFKI